MKYKGHLVGVNMRDKSKEGYSTSYCKYTFTSLSKNECREEIGHTLLQGTRNVCKQTFLADPYVFYLQTIFIFGIAVRTVLINQTIAKLILLLVIFTLLLKAQVMGMFLYDSFNTQRRECNKRLDGVMKQSTAKAVGEVNPMIYKSVENIRCGQSFWGFTK